MSTLSATFSNGCQSKAGKTLSSTGCEVLSLGTSRCSSPNIKMTLTLPTINPSPLRPAPAYHRHLQVPASKPTHAFFDTHRFKAYGHNPDKHHPEISAFLSDFCLDFTHAS